VVLDDQELSAILGKGVRSNAGEEMGRIIDVIVGRDGQTVALGTGREGKQLRRWHELWRNLLICSAGPAKPALGRGRIQRAVRRAFNFGSEVTSSEVYDWIYPRCRHLLTQARRHSARRVLMSARSLV
jgi:hypothetical protein